MTLRSAYVDTRTSSWLASHAGLDVDLMDGQTFERCLASMFEILGYRVTITETYDFGADLIVDKHGLRTAVQAKCQRGLVGDHAVQQAVTGRTWYDCHTAAIFTNSDVTSRARQLALRVGVVVNNRQAVTLMLQRAGMIGPTELLPPPLCQKCGIHLVQRHGRFGPFWGCSNFPFGCRSKAELRYSLILAP